MTDIEKTVPAENHEGQKEEQKERKTSRNTDSRKGNRGEGEKEGKRGGNRDENRGEKGDRVKYVRKDKEEGGEGDNEEKKYDGKKPYRNNRREGDDKNREGGDYKNREGGDRRRGGKKRENKESKYDWNRENVTVDTVIAEKPTKAKELKQPSQDQLESKLDAIEKQIEDIHLKKRKYLDELHKNNKQQKDENQKKLQPTRLVLTDKLSEKKKLREEFQDKQRNFQEIKGSIDELFDKSNKLRNKMKILKKKDQIEAELEEKEKILHNAYLSSQEEKKLVTQIEALQKSLPHSVPLAAVEDKIDQLQKEKKLRQKEMNEAYGKLKVLEDDIKELQRDMDEVKNFKEENKNQIEPLIAEKKSEYASKIDEHKAKKKLIKEEHDKARELYEDEQELIRHIDWQKRIKEKLSKEANRLKKEEQYKQQQDEEEKLEKERLAGINPYQEQEELCDILIKYTELKLTNKVQEKVEESVDRSKLIEENQANLNKEKLSYVVSARENTEEETGGKRAAKKKNKAQQNKKEDNLPQAINHQVEVLGYFDNVKVQAPLFQADFPKTLEQLKEKKAYYLKCAEEHKEGTTQEKETEEVEKTEETTQEEPEKKQSEEVKDKKKSAPQKKQKVVNVEDVDSFPTLG